MNKVSKILMTFLLIPIMTPVYNILDRLIFVEVFGCGCVPDVQVNRLNIAFNANDLRQLVYSLLTIIMVVLAAVLSKSFMKKSLRILYIFAVFVVNAGISFFICKTMMWG